MKKGLTIILLILLSLSFLTFLLANKKAFSWQFKPNVWQEHYERSQWVKGFEAEEILSDAELHTWAGWSLAQGNDPTEVNPEQPPLGKYLIGLSLVVFKNPNFQAPILGLFYLVSIFLVSQKLLKDRNLALLVVLVFSLETIFRENLTVSMLDLVLSLFIVLAFYFLLKGRKSPLWYLPMVVSLALVSVSKMYLLGFGLTFLIGFFLLLFSWIKKRRDFFYFLAFLPFFVLVYFLIYFKYFEAGHSLFDFKNYHFWVYQFARVQVPNYPKGEIIRILSLGQWQTWWNGAGVIKVEQWHWLWSLGILSLPLAIYLAIKRRDFNLGAVVLWPASLLAMYFLSVPYPRYLLPIIPGLYLILVYNLREVKFLWEKKRKN